MGDTVILTWREFDGQSYLVQMIRSNDGGNSWGEPQRLMETSGAADYPIPLISSKQLLVVWNTATEGLRVLTLDRIPAAN
jgi:hypothetical protein